MRPITVVEMDEFLAATRKLMDDEERAGLVNYLSFHPTAGVVVPGTGGVRKLRWGLEGRGTVSYTHLDVYKRQDAGCG